MIRQDHRRGIAQHGQGAQAKKIELEQADQLNVVFSELDDDGIFVAGQRRQVRQRLAGDDDAGRMGRRMARHPLKAHRHIDDFLDHIAVLVFMTQFRARIERFADGYPQ